MDDQKLLNLLRGSIVDCVHSAKAGHPGGALSSLDLAFYLYKDVLLLNPDDPLDPRRDRFVLSAGHESALLYSIFYMLGWLKEEDLAQFRQLGSRTPGHPEVHLTPGVECTTGPLGQGAAMSVGMAMAALHLHATGKYARANRIFTLHGDGCLQEGVTLAAASLAGHQQLHNLVWIYDKNKQQISGSTDLSYSDREEDLFKGFGWNVLRINGHDPEQIKEAYRSVLDQNERPSLIVADTVMAHQTVSFENNHEAHGAPLPDAERVASRKKWGLNEDVMFERDEKLCTELVDRIRQRFHNEAGDLPSRNPSTEALIEKLPFNVKPAEATRSSFGRLLEVYAKAYPQIIGGSADLEPSNKTEAFRKLVGNFSHTNREGRNIQFGVREFPMVAICNGLHLFDPWLRPFGATFLVFSDYSRPAIRLGAIQGCPVIHEMTHDSFYVGEDGPTHQPIEHLSALRSIPNLEVVRPADAHELHIYYHRALNLKKTPSLFALTRQNVPTVTEHLGEDLILNGLYPVFEQGKKDPHKTLLLFASGSELHLALEVAKELPHVVCYSVPQLTLFLQQSQAERDQLLPPDFRQRISIEAGSAWGWSAITGLDGLNIAMETFGESGKASDLAQHFGFTKEKVLAKIRAEFPVASSGTSE